MNKIKLDPNTAEKVKCSFIWSGKRLHSYFFKALCDRKIPIWNNSYFYYEDGKIWSYDSCIDMRKRQYSKGIPISSDERYFLDKIYNNLEEKMEFTNKPFRVIAYNDTEIINESTILAAGPQAARDKIVRELVLANNSIDIDSIKIKIVAWTPE